MIKNHTIELTNAVLRYPLGPHVKSSLKGSLFNVLGSGDKKVDREFITALDNISFTLTNGDKLGIIGRNGAGKSSLLRAIAGVYPLASGFIRIKGNIQGLFDIDIGFEPEATGRQNIKYRGLVMGIDPEETERRTDEIIAFADIGEFIDLPMRLYSSGMFIRLAFACSAYLEGDILLIDEFFSAGDANFQKRAVARMHQIIDKAGILVFVSHDIGLVETLCSRVIWLDEGKIVRDGNPSDIIADYRKEFDA